MGEDEKLQELLTDLSVEHREEFVNTIIKVGAENGYTFSTEDMKQLAVEQMMENGNYEKRKWKQLQGSINNFMKNYGRIK